MSTDIELTIEEIDSARELMREAEIKVKAEELKDLRIHIATAALQGMLASGRISVMNMSEASTPYKALAVAAYGYADALIKEGDITNGT